MQINQLNIEKLDKEQLSEEQLITQCTAHEHIIEHLEEQEVVVVRRQAPEFLLLGVISVAGSQKRFQ